VFFDLVGEGTIRVTFLAVPNRTTALLAKAVVVALASGVVGLIAGLVACYRGLNVSGGGAKAVGNAVNETVVYAFMALFVINVVVTAIGIQMTTGSH